MNRRVPVYHFICLGLFIISLFLPYIENDLYIDSPLLPEYLKEFRYESGLKYIEATIVPVLALLVISGIKLSVRNKATAIIGIVLAVLLIGYEVLLGFGLTITFFSASSKSLGLGYMLGFISILAYTGFSIANLSWVLRNKKTTRKARLDSEIIDDTDLLDTI